MRFRLAAAAVVAAISMPALAADLGVVYEPSPVYEPTQPQSFNWTGAYVGGHIGWAWDDADFTLDNGGWWGFDGDSTSIDGDGFIGGGQIGYWHQPNNFVFGVDVSGSWADLGDSTASPRYPGIDTWATEIDWLLLAQARAGVAMGRWIVFAQGGYAGAHASASATPPFVEDDNWHNGWTVGGGVAFKAHRWLSLGVEYNYVDLGGETYNLGGCGPCGGDETASVDHQIHVVKGTINFHFNGN